MKNQKIEIEWSDGIITNEYEGENWINAAERAGIKIPTGCLGGSCGMCEIEVNGEVLRACITNIKKETRIKVDIVTDPYW